MKDKIASRKFWTAIVTAALVVANDGLGLNLPSESIIAVSGIAISYILGQSHVDAKNN